MENIKICPECGGKLIPITKHVDSRLGEEFSEYECPICGIFDSDHIGFLSLKNINPLTPIVGYTRGEMVNYIVYGRIISVESDDTEDPYLVHDSVKNRDTLCYEVEVISEEILLEYIKLERG